MGIMAAAGPGDAAVKRGIDWLVRHQGADGNWEENFYTGTGFPRVFYLKYHLYRLYFPLMALARYKRLQSLQSRAVPARSGASRPGSVV
jgi:squalene-hopene/tetraprenyl-beta-curcumene cyclase